MPRAKTPRKTKPPEHRHLEIQYRPLAALAAYAKNPRLHSDDQIDQIAESIRHFGWTYPVLIDDQGTVVAGHGRILAEQRLGHTEVPVIVAPPDWTDDDKRAYRIADNKLTLNAAWDVDLLADEFSELEAQGFYLDLTGFDDDEQAKVMAEDDPLEIREVHTAPVSDRFWISIRGPLKDQAAALNRLREAMADLEDVEVELGSIAIEA